jgi:hypothetical protein
MASKEKSRPDDLPFSSSTGLPLYLSRVPSKLPSEKLLRQNPIYASHCPICTTPTTSLSFPFILPLHSSIHQHHHFSPTGKEDKKQPEQSKSQLSPVEQQKTLPLPTHLILSYPMRPSVH